MRCGVVRMRQPVAGIETRSMYSSPTIYRSGSRTLEVLPGESHSAAWTYITRGGRAPVSYPCAEDHVRRRVHRSSHRRPHRRRALTLVA